MRFPLKEFKVTYAGHPPERVPEIELVTDHYIRVQWDGRFAGGFPTEAAVVHVRIEL